MDSEDGLLSEIDKSNAKTIVFHLHRNLSERYTWGYTTSLIKDVILTRTNAKFE